MNGGSLEMMDELVRKCVRPERHRGRVHRFFNRRVDHGLQCSATEQTKDDTRIIDDNRAVPADRFDAVPYVADMLRGRAERDIPTDKIACPRDSR